jgi:hypothetical protein
MDPSARHHQGCTMNRKPIPKDAIIPDTPEKESFVRGLVDRGEASRADKEGKLPSGVTHEVVGHAPSGLPIVIERRKKLF